MCSIYVTSICTRMYNSYTEKYTYIIRMCVHSFYFRIKSRLFVTDDRIFKKKLQRPTNSFKRGYSKSFSIVLV